MTIIKITPRYCVVCGKNLNDFRGSRVHRKKASKRFKTCCKKCSKEYHRFQQNHNISIKKYLKKKKTLKLMNLLNHTFVKSKRVEGSSGLHTATALANVKRRSKWKTITIMKNLRKNFAF